MPEEVALSDLLNVRSLQVANSLSDVSNSIDTGGAEVVLFAVAAEGGGSHKGAHRPDTGEAD